MALPSLDSDAELVLCRCGSSEAGAKRGGGSAGNHYRVGMRVEGTVVKLGWQKPRRESTRESGCGQKELIGTK